MTTHTRRAVPTAGFVALVGLLLVVALAVVALGARSEQGRRDADQQLDAEVTRKVELANIVLSLCPGGRPVVDRLSLQDCVNAQLAVAEPIVTRVEADGVSVAQVRSIVLQELGTFTASAGRRPTDAELLELIQRVYSEHRPVDGRTPTDAELLALILPVINANLPEDGTDGEDGTDCDPSAIPECRGPAGPQGVGFESGTFVRVDSNCLYRVTLLDPATGRRSTADAPVPAALCDPPRTEPPPTTTADASPTSSSALLRTRPLGG